MVTKTKSIALSCAGLALLTLCACGSRELKGHINLDEDGEVVTDLSQVTELEDVYTQPRRYPFTVAVAPLYVEWADNGVNAEGESTVHPLTLANPVPDVDVLDHAVATTWPAGVDAEEEGLILEALRKGFVRDERADDDTEDIEDTEQAPEEGDGFEDGEPADGTPEDGAPADGAPADDAPEDGAPADGPPEDGAPADGPPEDGAPEDGAPADGTPEDGAPADGAPEDGATPGEDYPWPEEEGRPQDPTEVPLETPRGDTPAEDAASEDGADETPAGADDSEAPAVETPAGDPDYDPWEDSGARPLEDADEAPAQENDANESPADNDSVEEPADETPPADTPADETPPADTPADETPPADTPADDPWHDSGARPIEETDDAEEDGDDGADDQGSRLRRQLRRYPSRNAAPPPDGDEDGGEDGDGDAEEDGDGNGDAEEDGNAEQPTEEAPVDPLADHDAVLPARDASGSRLGLRLPEGFEAEAGELLRVRNAEALLFEVGSRTLPLDTPTPEDSSGLLGVVPGDADPESAPQAIELGGRAGWKFGVIRDDGTRWTVWGAYTESEAFALASPSDADPALQEELLSTVAFAPPAPEGDAEPEEDPEVVAQRMEQEAARAREADTFEGKNFGISETGWQDRTVGLLRQFGVFERVEKIEFSQDSQRANPLELLPLADLAGADMLLVAKLRRNRVSYQGINASYAGDFLAWLTFWWPSAIWPGISSEDYRADVELHVELRDVRSQAVLWSKTYRHDETLALSTPERGWVPWGVVFARFGLLTDGMLSGAGEFVRTPTWLEVEYQILRDLWSIEGFKGVIDTQTFEDRINTDVAPRRLALVGGVSTYGPRAQPVLNTLATEAAAKRGETLEALRAQYEDEELEFGVRPYAEADTQRLAQFLREQGTFNQDFSRSLIGPAATRTRLKATLRQLARARRDDPVLLYLNLRTVVVDDPDAVGDRLRKYLLPYDADLQGLEALLADPASPERAEALIAHLERTAISFAWLEETFNHASLEDHRYLQSRNVALVLDVAFPDPVTGLRYAPEFRARRDEEAEVRLSSDFLEPLAQVPGRLIVVGTQFFERPLDVVPKRSGGLVYHLLRGAIEDGRVPLAADGTKPLGSLLNYARRQIEKESRTLNRAQSVRVLGTNLGFPLVDRR